MYTTLYLGDDTIISHIGILVHIRNIGAYLEYWCIFGILVHIRNIGVYSEYMCIYLGDDTIISHSKDSTCAQIFQLG